MPLGAGMHGVGEETSIKGIQREGCWKLQNLFLVLQPFGLQSFDETKPDFCLDLASLKCYKGSSQPLEKTDGLKELLSDVMKYVSF